MILKILHKLAGISMVGWSGRAWNFLPSFHEKMGTSQKRIAKMMHLKPTKITEEALPIGGQNDLLPRGSGIDLQQKHWCVEPHLANL